jgi:hypothetical protein
MGHEAGHHIHERFGEHERQVQQKKIGAE